MGIFQAHIGGAKGFKDVKLYTTLTLLAMSVFRGIVMHATFALS